TAGQSIMLLQPIKKIPNRFRTVSFFLKALRSAPSSMAFLAKFVFAMPLAIFLMMFIEKSIHENLSMNLFQEQQTDSTVRVEFRHDAIWTLKVEDLILG
ncbi:MAG: hypothetical protein NTX30_21460, partial [Deltaproteobacteria bacterium]|nr:hypothetical protein [Deltaproteobacteria bacterium]